MICNYLLVENPAATLAFGCLLTALLPTGLSLALEKWMEKDMIFSRYYRTLVYLYQRKWQKRKKLRWWLKPLGLCIYCYSVHIGWVSYLVMKPAPLLWLPLFLGAEYVWLRLLQKAFK